MNERMTSREFTDLVGISLKKLERMEKDGKIVPKREGRIRYYYLEQVKQFEVAEGKLILGVDIPRDMVFTITYKETDSDITRMLDYCLQHNIQIDESVIISETDIVQGISEALSICRDPRVAKIVYSGKLSVYPVIEEECKKLGVCISNASIIDDKKNTGGIMKWLTRKR